ncbi:hypothetical protein Leryth_026320 [Lithospermum erythrorhizon]|nr:hypothetical protein Leryth_026320 [Lithospermum erythrorhizon]
MKSTIKMQTMRTRALHSKESELCDQSVNYFKGSCLSADQYWTFGRERSLYWRLLHICSLRLYTCSG